MYHSKVIAASQGALEGALGMHLREYSHAEVQEMAWRMKDVDWSLGSIETIGTLPEDIQEYILNELQLCKINFEYWASRYAHIVADTGKKVTFKPWGSQRSFLNLVAKRELEDWDYFMSSNAPELEAKIALILLKSRQVGGTIVSEVLLAHHIIFFAHTRSVIASDHPDNSLKLSRVLLCIFDNLPPWMKPIMDARVKNTNFHFPETDCDVIVGAGNMKTTLGQSMTIDVAHFTEVSTWVDTNARAIDSDMLPAFQSSKKHHSLFILESTGQGGKGNWYHDTWQAAMDGESEWHPIFVGWFTCPDKWAMRAENVVINAETEAIARRIETENDVKLTKEQLAWYQTKRRNANAKGELEIFLQEFPSSPEEAFQTGLKSVFTLETRAKVRDSCRTPQVVCEFNPISKKFKELNLKEFLYDPSPRKYSNKLLVWEWAKPGHLYVIGCDSSYGIDGGDSSAIEVIRVGNKYAPDEQVAEWYGDIPPGALADILWSIGHMYADRSDNLAAKLAIEVNMGSPGIVPQTDLMRRGYPNWYIDRRPNRLGGGWSKEIGWHTTGITRPLMTEGGCDALRRGDLLVNSPGVVKEMGTFISKTTATGQRHLEHAHGEHDDRLLALFIALYVAHELDTLQMADERRKVHDQANTTFGKSPSYQSMGISMEEAMAKWEESLA